MNLFEESTINPEAYKQLLLAIKSPLTKTDELLKFIKNSAGLDPELFMLTKK